MDRCALFVDAGYLLAEGGKHHVDPSARRGDVTVDYASLVARLKERARASCDHPLLRIYWYDGAVDGVPTLEQQAIGSIPDVKIRLGRLTRSGQKGVDALVYRDLSTLARERVIVTAFVLTGDEDIREGISAAQDLGVHVTLWGIGIRDNQSRTLVAEADRNEHLDDLGDCFQLAAGSSLALAAARSGASTVSVGDGNVERVVDDFVAQWLASAIDDDIGDLLRARPVIPSALDAELLRHVQAVVGDLRHRADVRRSGRAAFWIAMDRHGGTPPS